MDDRSIGTWLAEARRRRRLSKAAAGEALDVSRMTYDLWERDAWDPRPEDAERIAFFTGRQAAEIVAALGESGHEDGSATPEP